MLIWHYRIHFRHLQILQGVRYLNFLNIRAYRQERLVIIFQYLDLIRDEREGKFIYYELNASVLEELMLWISEFKGEK